jgi:hypothetical protein
LIRKQIELKINSRKYNNNKHENSCNNFYPDFLSILALAQINKTNKTGAKSFVPGVIDEIRSAELGKSRILKSKNVSVYYDYLPQEDHATIMHQAFFNAFRILYPLPSENK